MDKDSIKKLLSEKHHSFLMFVNKLTADDFVLSKNEKWTAGWQLEHIYLAVKPVRQILSLPKK